MRAEKTRKSMFAQKKVLEDKIKELNMIQQCKVSQISINIVVLKVTKRSAKFSKLSFKMNNIYKPVYKLRI